MENQVDLSAMSTDQLEALLKQKKAEEKQALKTKQRAYEASRHEYVCNAVNFFNEYNKNLKEFKELVFEQGKQLYDQMFDVYGKEAKETKSFSLESNDGLKKVEIEFHERIEFDERAVIHIATLKQVFRDKFQNRNQKMYNMLETLLVKNKAGDYDPRLLTKLNKHRDDIDDARFSEALDNLANCHKVAGTSKYIRAYERRELDGAWEVINIQFSAL